MTSPSEANEALIIRQATEALMAEGEEVFRLIFESNSAALAIINPDTTIALVNDAYCTMSGYSKVEAIGLSWTTQIPPEDLGRLQEYNRRRLANPADAPDAYEFSFYHKNGEIRHGLMSVAMMANARKIIASFSDITDRRRAEAELALANRLVSAINAELQASLAEVHARNEGLEIMSRAIVHDLRSMLNVVIGYADFLAEHTADAAPPEYRQATKGINTATSRMMQTLDDLLLLAKVDGVAAPRVPLDMEQLVLRVLHDLAPTIAAVGADIILPSNWPRVLGHGPWVEVIWRNYLANACKFGGKNPRISIEATLRKDAAEREEALFTVRDSGVGIDPAEQDKIFQPFSRLDTVRVEGHGLGLSIVRRIAEKLGGSVCVESSGRDGEGSAFCFTLPVVSPDTPVRDNS